MQKIYSRIKYKELQDSITKKKEKRIQKFNHGFHRFHGLRKDRRKEECRKDRVVLYISFVQ